MSTPFNPGAHANLLELGYIHVHHEADWEDVGDGESGPRLSGGPAWDCYDSDDDYIAVEENGTVHGPYPQTCGCDIYMEGE